MTEKIRTALIKKNKGQETALQERKTAIIYGSVRISAHLADAGCADRQVFHKLALNGCIGLQVNCSFTQKNIWPVTMNFKKFLIDGSSR